MHIEKNVCDNILGTLLAIDGKSKDNIQARLDLKELGIRKELHPLELDGGKMYLPPPTFLMSKKEKETFLSILKSLRVPDGYSSNISRSIQLKEKKISGLKSHDCHILMQQLFTVAIRTLLQPSVCSALVNFCAFFNQLCSKVIDVAEFERLEGEIAVTLCQLERIFPPSFFTIMMHLPVHLAFEARIAGHVQYRWMYPIERYLLTLKRYVRNKSKPEGSIAEGYLADESLTFCSRYLQNVDTRLTREERNYDGTPIGVARKCRLERITLEQAHRHVLFNYDIIDPYIR